MYAFLSQSESFIVCIQIALGFLAAPPSNSSSENGGDDRFVSVGCFLEEFVQHQENKNTLSKTRRDV